MSDPTYDFLASGGGPEPSSGDATHDFLASGGQMPADTPASPTVSAGSVPWKQTMGGMFRHMITGIGSSAVAGARSVYDMAHGVPLSEVDKRNQKFISEHTYQPTDTSTQAAVTGAESDANPMNWAGKVFDVLGDTINNATDPRSLSRRVDVGGGNPLLSDKAGTSGYGPPSSALPTTGTGSTALGPIISGIGQVALGAAPFMPSGEGGVEIPTARSTPGWGAETTPTASAPTAAPTAPTGVTAPELSASGAGRAAPFEPQDIPGRPGVSVDTEPVEGGLPKTATNQRSAILARVGLDSARDSALEGNAKDAATDWQLSKFDEPAGVQAKAQFDSERTALQQHAEGLVKQTGGTLGTDEDTLHARGQTIAKPFDALSDWFDEQRKKLYGAADQRSQGAPVVQPSSLQNMLDDQSFKNQLTARGQLNVRDGVSAELSRFLEGNQPGLTVQNSEQFRQFLNSLWTPENSRIIGRLKGALDDDVMRGAGEDLYGPARALVQMQKQTLENPNGISKLLERDPQTPINRTTPYVKIADTLTRLDPDQFNNILRTLQTMPEELQPQAQEALAEIKAHLANKVYDAGNSTSGQWNARGVEKVVKANSVKLASAFEDQPEVLQGIQDLRSAGNILSVNQGYPGAAAQASNALRRGFMSRALSKVGATAGAGAGSVLGPFGAAAGAAVGEAAGGAAGAKVAERSAVKQWQSRVTKLSDLAEP